MGTRLDSVISPEAAEPAAGGDRGEPAPVTARSLRRKPITAFQKQAEASASPLPAEPVGQWLPPEDAATDKPTDFEPPVLNKLYKGSEDYEGVFPDRWSTLAGDTAFTLSSPHDYNDVTLCAWVWLDPSPAPLHAVIASNQGDGVGEATRNRGYTLSVSSVKDSSELVQFQLAWGSRKFGPQSMANVTHAAELGQWLFVAMAFTEGAENDGNAFLFVNGKLLLKENAPSCCFAAFF
jgi:Concanavalin A-like lectin/glucanases superfamily